MIHWVTTDSTLGMFRLLKPGERVAVSDILAKKVLPLEMRQDVALYVGCIAGASRVEQYRSYLEEAGFNGAYVLLCKRVTGLTCCVL